MSLKAITFDIWDTILIDDSDEPVRAERGLRPKPDEKRHLVWEALNAEAPIEPEAVEAAFARQEAAFREAWYGEQITWEVPERLKIMLADLGRTLNGEAFDQVVAGFENMEVDLPPDMIDGAANAIRELAGRFRLSVVSDTIYTPGRGLRDILSQHGIKDFFTGFVFSDEVGHSKPHPDMFAEAARQLGTEYADMLHIGDRDPKDVDGAQALGMKAILFTAARDEGAAAATKADAVAASYAELVDKIDAIAG